MSGYKSFKYCECCFYLICRRRQCREHTEHARIKHWQPSDASRPVAEGGHSSRQNSNLPSQHQLWRGVVSDGGSFLPQGLHDDLPHHHYHRPSSVHPQALPEKTCCPGSRTVRFRRYVFLTVHQIDIALRLLNTNIILT